MEQSIKELQEKYVGIIHQNFEVKEVLEIPEGIDYTNIIEFTNNCFKINEPRKYGKTELFFLLESIETKAPYLILASEFEKSFRKK